jgi:type VI secretion system protein ImpE
MTTPTPAEQALRDGDPQAALKLLQDQVRQHPGDAKLRVFLFQLLCVLGQWDRALNQLNVAGELDASTLAMVQTYREALQCERLREQVFEGRRAPMLFGEPQTWIALLIEALLLEGRGQGDAARKLRDRAFEEAPASPGRLDGEPFEWIADADMRLGPALEAVINGRYYWVPFSHLAEVTFDAPADLRDAVWMPAHVEFANGGDAVALVPTRYAGTDLADPMLALARRTEWHETAPGFHAGRGQRLLATEAGERALMDVRSIAFGARAQAQSEDAQADPEGQGAA